MGGNNLDVMLKRKLGRSILLGASSLGLVFIYPFMKRVTYYPQIVLGKQWFPTGILGVELTSL